jgi:hypothetical protein
MDCLKLVETKEEILKRWAYQRYQRRISLGLSGNDKTDWEYAQEDYLHYTKLHCGKEDL